MMHKAWIGALVVGLTNVQMPEFFNPDPALTFCRKCEVHDMVGTAVRRGLGVAEDKTGSHGSWVVMVEPDGTQHKVVWYSAGPWMDQPCNCGRNLGAEQPKGLKS